MTDCDMCGIPLSLSPDTTTAFFFLITPKTITSHFLPTHPLPTISTSVSSFPLPALIDTGCPATLLSHSAWKKFSDFPLQSYSKPVASATGHPLSVYGTYIAPIVICDTNFSHPVVEISDNGFL